MAVRAEDTRLRQTKPLLAPAFAPAPTISRRGRNTRPSPHRTRGASRPTLAFSRQRYANPQPLPADDGCSAKLRTLDEGKKTGHSHRQQAQTNNLRRDLMKTLVTTGLTALLLATTGYAALAGTITGAIKGPDGAPFRAAFVRVQNLSNKITMMVLTDSQGRYF